MSFASTRLFLQRSSAALLLALIPACGGGADPAPTGGSGGAGGSGATTALCDSYCTGKSACIEPADCTLADAAAYAKKCIARCEGGFEGVDANDSSIVEACLSCAVKAAAGACLEELPKGTCKAECEDTLYKPAAKRWFDAGEKVAASDDLCTNGKSVEGASCSGGSNDDTSCYSECSNPGSATSDVSATCTSSTPDGAATCTCTAGKSKGKTFTVTSCSHLASVSLWNQCNL